MKASDAQPQKGNGPEVAPSKAVQVEYRAGITGNHFRSLDAAAQAHSEIDVAAMIADMRARTAALAFDLALLGGYIAGRRGEVH